MLSNYKHTLIIVNIDFFIVIFNSLLSYKVVHNFEVISSYVLN